MRLLKYPLLLVYSIWAYFWFFFWGAFTVLMSGLTLLVRGGDPGQAMFNWNHRFEHIWSFFSGMRYQVTGLQHFMPGQAYIITCNHKAIADLFIVAHALQTVRFRPLSKIELTRLPIVGFLFKHSIVAVDRASKESRQKSVQAMETLVKEKGMSLLVFPEGTRNRTPFPLKDFYDGAFKVAIDCQVPIIPMVILDTDVITPPNTPWMRPGTLTCHFLPAVPTAGLTEADIATLKEKVYLAMESEVIKHRHHTQGREVGLSAYG